MQHICKRFGAVVALSNVDFNVRRGTVHALIGENGAGKSTLMKILSGSIKADRGQILFDDNEYFPDGPRQARETGISMIYQELTLAPHLTVEENITLGLEQHHLGILKHQRTEVKNILNLLGRARLDPDIPVRRLSIADQQLVEIARALFTKAEVIVMDEPTSSLSASDAQNLFQTIKELKSQGITIIYISHFLEEIQQVADDYTVLRDGHTVATGSMGNVTLNQIVTYMVGRALEDMFPRVPHSMGNVVLSVRHLQHPPFIKEASFDLHAGEILGIAGLVGSGRTNMARSIYGLDAVHKGIIKIKDRKIQDTSHHPSRSLAYGISMLSENRKEEGLAVTLPIRDNISLSSLSQHADRFGRIRQTQELGRVTQTVQQIALKYNHLLDPVLSLSGGNQQKVALARVLLDGSPVLLLDEPTRGIDVHSKVEIYQIVGELAVQGYGILLISSYLPELFGICDTLAVMHRGTLSPVKPIDRWSEEEVMSWATTGKIESKVENA